ncbi:MAG: hypothetical protein AAGB04_30880, partial [Pseudomonadota bacterium]
MGGQPLLGESDAYVVSSDAEWDAVFANDAATLSGSTVEIVGSNFTQRTINNKDIDAAGAPLTIRSQDANSRIPSLQLTGTVRGINFSGLNIQMSGWPRDYAACFSLGTGTFGKLRFLDGCTLRHGYGSGLVDFDTQADLPEYERIDNVETATTTSAAYALTWKDSAAPTGWIEFFNRGSEPVYVAVGGSGVAASASDTEVAPGARERINSLDPDVDTHFAVIAAAGTSEVNARTEIGLSEYLANAFQQSGSAVLEDIEIRNCLFRDLSNAVKGLRPIQSALIMDCDFDRIYQDIVAIAPEPGATVHVLRNIECLPFARSGIAENLDGDARDPHGDQFQTFYNGAPGTIGPIYYAGNRPRLTPRRSGIKSQGIFVSDNDNDPSYTDLFFISTMQIGGAGRALSLGEESTNFKIRDAFIYGATVLDGSNLSSDLPFILVDHDGDGTVYVGKSIATALTITDAPWQQDDNLVLSNTLSRAGVFPGFDNLTSATSRETIEAALTSSSEGDGLGATATRDAINWTTNDYASVIRWDNLPSGAHWNALTNQAASTMITLPLRKIMNRRASQSVSVAAGTEWRSVDTDGATEVQGWTSSAGTIEPDQFIQIRTTSSAIGNTAVTAAVTINGFEQGANIVTANVQIEPLVIPGDGAAWFRDPANVPAGTQRITFEGQFYFPGSVPNNVKFFTQASTGCDLSVLSNGTLRATIEDGAGAKMLLNAQVAP